MNQLPGRIQLAFLLLGVLAFPAKSHAQGFAKGADVGWLPQMEATGFKFFDRRGQPADCLNILKENGIDAIRLRVFVHPSNDPRSGHCSRDEVVAMAVRARKLGFRILIDFHYSDSWADPARQIKPAAWAKHSFEELKTDVYEHTLDVLQALKAKNVVPEWVQIGNEITAGMLWPDGKPASGSHLAELINAGYRAVKESNPSIKVIVHLDRGQDNRLYRWFFDRLQQNGAKFDVIGLSYYPYWLKSDYTKSIDGLGENLNDMVQHYGKEVMVVETGGEETEPENTRAMLVEVLKRVRAVPEGKGLGVIYWEPEGADCWSNYRLSCWEANGRPTIALTAFLEGKAPSR